jgi:hypothetical protein
MILSFSELAFLNGLGGRQGLDIIIIGIRIGLGSRSGVAAVFS